MKSWPHRHGLLLCALCLPLPLSATLITYTMTGENLNALLGSSLMQGVPFTFVFNGDTASIGPDAIGLGNPILSNSFTIGAVSGEFTEPLIIRVNPASGYAGFWNLAASGTFLYKTDFLGWDLATPIGPIVGSGPSEVLWTGNFGTSLGVLQYLSTPNLTFQAFAQEIPEPATAALIGGGVLLLALLRRK